MKKICFMVCCILSLLFLNGCSTNTASQYESKYNVAAKEYSSFIELPINNSISNVAFDNYSVIDLYSDTCVSQNEILVDYCLYNDGVIAIFGKDNSYSFYYIDNDSSEKLCNYTVNDNVAINDMCSADYYVYWLEEGSDLQNSVMRFNTQNNHIEKIGSATETKYLGRMYSDGNSIYCSEYNSETNKWNICRYENNSFTEFKTGIYVSNPYNPFFIGDGYIQYLSVSEDNLMLNVENLKTVEKSTINLGVKPTNIGVNIICCNSDFIAWRDIKNITDYSSIAAITYDVSKGKTFSTMVTKGKDNLSSLTSGIIGNNMFVHFSSDFNQKSNIFIYDLKKDILFNLTNNSDEEVYFSYPEIFGNKLTFTKEINQKETNIYICEL